MRVVTLAELGYPAGDDKLIRFCDQTLNWLFSDDYLATLGKVHGLPRLHGSIEGNALWAMLRLGLTDDRAAALAERLRNSQWPDGGWNCDRKANGRCSSFSESLIPLRAPHLHAQIHSDADSAAAAGHAGAFFLRRRLYRAEHRYHHHTSAMVPSQRSLVNWGGVDVRRSNPWASARAAVVLHAAGRPVEDRGWAIAAHSTRTV